MFRIGIATLVAAHLLNYSVVEAQEADEVTRLKERIELLETKLKLAEKENELLRKENEQLKENVARGKQVAKSSLSDLLPEGTVISGDYRSPLVKNVAGKATVSITNRDGKKVKGTGTTKWGAEEPAEHSFEGEIKGSQLTLRSIGGSLRINMTVILKGDSLEGTWSDSMLQKGTIGFKLPK